MPKKEPSVQELKRENQRLKRENMMLKNELEELHGHQRKETGNKYVDTLRRQAKNEQLFSKKRYLGYLTEALRRTSVFQIYSRIIHAFRRISFIRISTIFFINNRSSLQLNFCCIFLNVHYKSICNFHISNKLLALFETFSFG